MAFTTAATSAATLILCASYLLYHYPPIEIARHGLTALFHVQSVLPAGAAKNWRIAVTSVMHLVPAIDPTKDPYVTRYKPPAKCVAYDHEKKQGSAVLITGGTGFIGIHLIDLLLRTTNRRIYVLVRTKSAGKLQREAARFQLQLPGFEGRVTLLDGDCKRVSLGLPALQ